MSRNRRSDHPKSRRRAGSRSGGAGTENVFVVVVVCGALRGFGSGASRETSASAMSTSSRLPRRMSPIARFPRGMPSAARAVWRELKKRRGFSKARRCRPFREAWKTKKKKTGHDSSILARLARRAAPFVHLCGILSLRYASTAGVPLSMIARRIDRKGLPSRPSQRRFRNPSSGGSLPTSLLVRSISSKF